MAETTVVDAQAFKVRIENRFGAIDLDLAQIKQLLEDTGQGPAVSAGLNALLEFGRTLLGASNAPAPTPVLAFASNPTAGVEGSTGTFTYTAANLNGSVAATVKNAVTNATISDATISGTSATFVRPAANTSWRIEMTSPGAASVSSATFASTALPPTQVAPSITTQPAISGGMPAQVGRTLTATRGAATGTPTPTATDTWFRGTTQVGSGLTYLPVAADQGAVLTFRTTWSNGVNPVAIANFSTATVVAAPQADTSSDLRTLNYTANTYSGGGTAEAVTTGTRDNTGLLVTPARTEGGTTRTQVNESPTNAMGAYWYPNGVSRTDLGVDADSRFRAVRLTGANASTWVEFCYARGNDLNKTITASVWYRAGTGGRARIHAYTNNPVGGLTIWEGPAGALVAAADNANDAVTIGASELSNVSVGGGIYRADVRITPSTKHAGSEWNIGIGPGGNGDVVVLGANVFIANVPFGSFTSTVGTYNEGGKSVPAVTAQLTGVALSALQRAGTVVNIAPAGIATLNRTTGQIAAVGAGGRVTTITLGVSTFATGNAPRNALGVPFVFMPGGNDLSVGNGDGDTNDPNGRAGGRWGESHPSLIPYLVAAFGGTGLKPILRIPFKWERVQPVRNAALGGTVLNGKSEWKIVREIIERCCAQGVVPMPEPHNYNRRFEAGVEKVVGVNFPREDLGDLWRRIMDDTASIPGIENMIVGSMNEPVEYGNGRGANLPMSEWILNQNALIQAIRNGNYNNLIAAPVVGFTHAYNLKSSGYGLAMSNGIVDPAKNWCFDLHEYFNQGRSGAGPGSAAAVSGHGAASFVEARDLCEERTAATGYKHTFIVGENSFAGRNGSQSASPADGDNTNAIAEATIALDFIQANRVGGPRAGGGTALAYCYWKFNQRSAAIGNADDVNDADPPGGYLSSYPIGSYGPQVTLMRQRFQLA